MTEFYKFTPGNKEIGTRPYLIIPTEPDPVSLTEHVLEAAGRYDRTLPAEDLVATILNLRPAVYVNHLGMTVAHYDRQMVIFRQGTFYPNLGGLRTHMDDHLRSRLQVPYDIRYSPDNFSIRYVMRAQEPDILRAYGLRVYGEVTVAVSPDLVKEDIYNRWVQALQRTMDGLDKTLGNKPGYIVEKSGPLSKFDITFNAAVRSTTHTP